MSDHDQPSDLRAHAGDGEGAALEAGARPRPIFQVREVCWVAIDSWAGRSTHQVQIEHLNELRASVRWLDAPIFGKQPGRVYNVPLIALRKRPIAERRG